MKKIILGTAVAAACLSGCRAIPQEHEKCINEEAGNQLGQKFVQSFADDNPQIFLECLSAQLQQGMNEEKFITSYQKITEQFGEVENFELMGNLENPLYQIQIWKLRFVKNTTVNDLIFRVLLAQNEEGQMKIVSFAFL